MMPKLILAACCGLTVLCASCDRFMLKLDQANFEKFGGTMFSSPDQVSIKQIHLDTGSMVGQEIIIEGNVVNTGDFATHLILSDESARMLVVLTDLVNAQKLLENHQPSMLRILGTVERGKKGLPFIMARALNPVEQPKT